MLPCINSCVQVVSNSCGDMFMCVAIYKFNGFMYIYLYGHGMSRWLHVYTCGDIIIHVAIYKFMWLHVYSYGFTYIQTAACIYMWLFVIYCHEHIHVA